MSRDSGGTGLQRRKNGPRRRAQCGHAAGRGRAGVARRHSARGGWRMIATAARATSLLRAARTTRTAAAAAAPGAVRSRVVARTPSRVEAARCCSAAVAIAQREAVRSALRERPASDGAKDAPGVMLIQEWWGVNVEIKALGARLAEKGYRVLIDIYNGKLALDAERPTMRCPTRWPGPRQICDGVACTTPDRRSASQTCMGGRSRSPPPPSAEAWRAPAVLRYARPGLADCRLSPIPVQAHTASSRPRRFL